MSYKVKKVIKDENNYGYAISDEVANEGTLFDLSSNDLVLRSDYNEGVGLFDVDISDDLMPTNSTGRVDVYFEIDGDGNLTPKS